MIEYLKMIIAAIITGITAPLPVSSSAHFSFLTNVLGLSGDETRFSLYYSAFIAAFAVVIFISFRKIYIGCLKSVLVSKKNKEEYGAVKGYKFIFKNVLVSLVPTCLLFIPVSKEKLLMDYFDAFLSLNGLILAGFACVITACVLVISLWYTRKNLRSRNQTTGLKTALRLSLYQLPCYIIPGFSHVAAGSVNLLICDVKSKTFLRELYVYLAPSMFVVGLVKLIRCVASGILFDPFVLIAGVIFFAVCARLILALTTRLDVRRMFAFFAIYSFVFGIFIAGASFFI